jgi:hypothetical protein
VLFAWINVSDGREEETILQANCMEADVGDFYSRSEAVVDF